MSWPDSLRGDGGQWVHLIAVCGTGMGALACMLKDAGFRVTGSDQNVYPPMSEFLAQHGIRVMAGFSADHLAGRPDLVVVGNAVTRDNPEAQRTFEMDLPYCSMPEAVNRIIAEGKQRLVVTGTHGKTTTSALLAWVLHRAGADPSFLIGGLVRQFNANYRVGSGPAMVIEGDEYDTAFFDKRPKFHHYDPRMAILTSIELDHADIFRDLDQIAGEFRKLVAHIDPAGALFAWDGDPLITDVVRSAACPVFRYGTAPNSDWRLGEVTVEPPWTRFVVHHQKTGASATFRTRLMGEHNLHNALAVIGTADALGIEMAAIADAIETFEGVRRRQEIRGTADGVTVMDDFAHHPTAVRETIRAVRPHVPDGRLIAVFEPRSNTSMRRTFQSVYPDAFTGADLVCIRFPSMIRKVPEDQRIDTAQLLSDLKVRGHEAHLFPDTDAVIDFLTDDARSGDTVLVMSNGGFDNIHTRLLARLTERERDRHPPADSPPDKGR